MLRSRKRGSPSSDAPVADDKPDKEGDVLFTASYLTESDKRAAKLILGLYTVASLIAGILAIGVAIAIAANAIRIPPSQRWFVAIAILVFGVVLGVVAMLRAIRNSPRVQEAAIRYPILLALFF